MASCSSLPDLRGGQKWNVGLSNITKSSAELGRSTLSCFQSNNSGEKDFIWKHTDGLSASHKKKARKSSKFWKSNRKIASEDWIQERGNNEVRSAKHQGNDETNEKGNTGFRKRLWAWLKQMRRRKGSYSSTNSDKITGTNLHTKEREEFLEENAGEWPEHAKRTFRRYSNKDTSGIESHSPSKAKQLASHNVIKVKPVLERTNGDEISDENYESDDEEMHSTPQHLDEREETLKRREQALTEREQEMTGREQEMREREQDMNGREQRLITKEEAIQQKDVSIMEREIKMCKTFKRLSKMLESFLKNNPDILLSECQNVQIGNIIEIHDGDFEKVVCILEKLCGKHEDLLGQLKKFIEGAEEKMKSHSEDNLDIREMIERLTSVVQKPPEVPAKRLSSRQRNDSQYFSISSLDFAASQDPPSDVVWGRSDILNHVQNQQTELLEGQRNIRKLLEEYKPKNDNTKTPTAIH